MSARRDMLVAGDHVEAGEEYRVVGIRDAVDGAVGAEQVGRGPELLGPVSPVPRPIRCRPACRRRYRAPTSR